MMMPNGNHIYFGEHTSDVCLVSINFNAQHGYNDFGFVLL